MSFIFLVSGQETFQASKLTKIEIPSSEDLLLRRLQGELELRVEDNWLSLTGQRWQIMKTKDPKIQILKSFNTLRENILKLEKTIGVEKLEKVLNNLKVPNADYAKWSRFWDSVKMRVGQIAQLYNYFKGYVKNPEAVTEDALKDFSQSLAVPNTEDKSLQKMLDAYHETICPSDSSKKHLFPYLSHLAEKEGDHLCALEMSPHHLLYNLYNIVALTEIKGYAMLQFSYMMLKIIEQADFSQAATEAKSKFEKQATEKMDSIKMVLPHMSKEFRRCDPIVHKEGETYLEVTKLLQGYIENEVDMNERQTCKSNCAAYTFTDSKSCYKDLFCAKQPKCNGRIFDCQFFNADAWVCMAENEQKRRYDWVEYENGIQLGEKGTCKNKIKVDSWWRYIFWHCSYCLCKCDEITEDSHRFWSLKPVVADKDANMIVTGLRFVKRNRIIYPEIQVAEAFPEGGVSGAKTWNSSEEISYSKTSDLPKNKAEVYTMSYEQREVDLDTLMAPDGHVLTGVKMRNIGGHLNLEIEVTPINFVTGKLIKDRATWIANDNTPATSKPRKLVPMVMPDIPTKWHGQNAVDSSTDQFIQFDSTSAHKDVSQTTVPFIDSQDVAPTPATWLAGAGLYHKGRVGYGGFVGLKVLNYDFARHLVPDNGDETPHLHYQFVKAEDA